MQEQLIAPCGMNCALCVSYRFMADDLNRHGFHKRYCPGCIPRGKHCTFMANSCERVGKGRVRFCFECPDYPCKRLKALDKRYHEKYNMSMIENLESIKTNGMESFLNSQQEKWRCPVCGGVICCHNGLCLTCDIEKLKADKTLHKTTVKDGELSDDHFLEYKTLLRQGRIQKAYRSILSFMSRLKTTFGQNHPGFIIGSLYPGQMDMSFFTFTPKVLHSKKLKIAVVFLHEPFCFEGWLCAANRAAGKELSASLAKIPTGALELADKNARVDWVLKQTLCDTPNFENSESLAAHIEAQTLAFIRAVEPLVT